MNRAEQRQRDHWFHRGAECPCGCTCARSDGQYVGHEHRIDNTECPAYVQRVTS